MAEPTTLLKVGSADLVLRMAESGLLLRDLALENPIRAIREMIHDITVRRTVRLTDGRTASALDIPPVYLSRAKDFADREGCGIGIHARGLDLWERTLEVVRMDNLALVER